MQDSNGVVRHRLWADNKGPLRLHVAGEGAGVGEASELHHWLALVGLGFGERTDALNPLKVWAMWRRNGTKNRAGRRRTAFHMSAESCL